MASTKGYFAIKPPRQPATADVDAAYGISAFWWVSTTDNDKEVNMQTKVMEHGGVTIPCLCNTTRAIKAHEKLVCKKW